MRFQLSSPNPSISACLRPAKYAACFFDICVQSGAVLRYGSRMKVDLNDLLAASPLPQIAIGGDERIVAINAAAEALFGPDMIGRHYIRAVRQPAVLDEIEVALQSGTRRDARYLGRSGSQEIAFRVTIAPLAIEGRNEALLVSFEDTSAVEEADRMRSDFIANLSHELRSPLTSLIGFVETLRGPARNDPEGQQRLLAIMERESRRMIMLVEDLMSLSRVEATERQRPSDPVDLPKVIENVVARLEPMIAQSASRVEVSVSKDFQQVRGSAQQLEQVVSNLIENALKYGGGTPVTVSLEGPQVERLLGGQGVCLRVADQGPGIAAHHLPRLTERFYRVDSHRAREAGGTGLGLAIVKHIVNRHRGRMRIESTLGQGTTIKVLLPLV